MATLDWSIIGPALGAGLLVLLSHVPLGRQVLTRGIIFIDLAVAQAAATGLLAGRHWLHLHGFWTTQACALAAALVCVLFLHWLERFGNRIQEAMIGGTFVALASLSMLLLAASPRSGEHLSTSLSGQILWVEATHLWTLAGAALLTLACMRLFRHPLAAFYLPFCLAVTASVQAVGIYLVFASLIFPALAVVRLRANRALTLALITGTLGYLAGLSASLVFDWPSGPAVVVALAVIAVVANRLIAFADTGGIGYNRANQTHPHPEEHS